METTNLNEMLGEEIVAGLADLSNMDRGSEEYSKAVDSLSKLYKVRIEDLKNEWEYSDRFARREIEIEQRKNEAVMKKYQVIMQGIDFLCKHGIDLGLGLMTLYIQYYFLNKGFEFETDGYYKSTTFKGIFPKLKTKR